MNKGGAQVADPGAHDELFVITSRRFVAATRVSHRNVAAIALLHFFVVKAELAHQFDAAHFKPDQEIRVIHHAHLVGFGIAHAEPAFSRNCAHLPLHFGLRFSRNEVMPSRKSSVVRMRALSITACETWRSSESFT